jgi:TRAP-type mannitol/chloroaromatic compound transport system permease small subunit
MDALLAWTRAVDRLSWFFGLIAACAVLAASLLGAFDALVGFGIRWLDWAIGRLAEAGPDLEFLLDLYRERSNALGDALMVLFAVMVMLGAPWTLKVNEHVRVDLFYTMVGDRARVWIDLLGGVFFLLPFCAVMIGLTWPWFLESWRTGEMGVNAGGLPRWPSKLMLPLGFALVALQGVAEIVKCVAALTRGYRREHAYEKPVQ